MIKPIITNISELRRPCLEVTKEDNIKEIIQDLKDTLESKKGLGITANQIGISKQISYIKVPKNFDTKNKQWIYSEYILINAKILEKERPIKIQNESCLSFPGLKVTTKRYVFIVVEYQNEKLDTQTAMFQDLESLVVQHEISHQQGKTILDFKWRAE